MGCLGLSVIGARTRGAKRNRTGCAAVARTGPTASPPSTPVARRPGRDLRRSPLTQKIQHHNSCHRSQFDALPDQPRTERGRVPSDRTT